jgi:hypothetical protein
MNCEVQPSSRLHIVKTSNDDLEFRVETHVEFLNFGRVVIDLNSRTALHYELGSNLSLVLANIFLSKEELPVKVCDINGI